MSLHETHTSHGIEMEIACANENSGTAKRKCGSAKTEIRSCGEYAKLAAGAHSQIIINTIWNRPIPWDEYSTLPSMIRFICCMLTD